jgi:hypothetical protein
MSVSPRARASAIFTTVATVVCCAPEPPRSAKFNSPWDNPRRGGEERSDDLLRGAPLDGLANVKADRKVFTDPVPAPVHSYDDLSLNRRLPIRAGEEPPRLSQQYANDSAAQLVGDPLQRDRDGRQPFQERAAGNPQSALLPLLAHGPRYEQEPALVEQKRSPQVPRERGLAWHTAPLLPLRPARVFGVGEALPTDVPISIGSGK